MKAAFTHWIGIKRRGGQENIYVFQLGHRPHRDCASCKVIKKALKLAKIKTIKTPHQSGNFLLTNG